MSEAANHNSSTSGGYGFGAFKGVFTPSILTIIGVVMYLRFGWVLGNVGLPQTLLIVTVSSSITFLTGLSLSALATNRKVRVGGAYYLVSRSFGAETGAAIGISLFLSQAISISFYIAGFTEALHGAIPAASGWDPRVVGSVTLIVIAALSIFSANLALKAQFVIMLAIAVSLVSFFLGGPPDQATLVMPAAGVPKPLGFWSVLAIFFPAVTGILSGLGMSGDLRDPARAIPSGTIAAVLVGYLIYMAVPLAMHAFLGGSPALVSDPLAFQKCARWQGAVLVGVWAACLSSALGSMLAAPRVMQALARDRIIPLVFGRGYGRNDDPRIAALTAFALAAAGIWAGGIDLLAPVLTMVNLTVYGLLNLSAAFEEMMGSASWRPTFRVPWGVALLGFAGCAGMMLMISPGATFVSLAFIIALYAVTMRRRLNSRWGDFRRGLMLFVAGALLRRLAWTPESGRTWQPNLLVLCGAPAKRWWLVELAAAISRDRGLLTLASVIPDGNWSAERAAHLDDMVRERTERQGVPAFVRFQSGETPWEGMRELIRSYGFGPIVPNTVLAGFTADDEAEDELASVVKLAIQRKRNVGLVISAKDDDRDDADDSAPSRVDLWWRGKGPNAPFLLALACQIVRSHQFEGAELRLCHVAEAGEDPATAESVLQAFLRQARVTATVEIVPMAKSPADTIIETSGDAALVLLGLRPPLGGETDASYGSYLATTRAAYSELQLALFAVAAESIDFHGVFE